MKRGKFIKEMRSADNKNQDTPIILLSAYLQEAKDTIEGVSNLYYLNKPILLAKLLTLIENALGICSYRYKLEEI